MQNHNQHMYVLLYRERNTFCYFFFWFTPYLGGTICCCCSLVKEYFLLTNTCFTIGI